jgi:hypothetical protein
VSVKKERWVTIGTVGVDSGTLIIGDPCYLDGEKLFDKVICPAFSKMNSGLALQIDKKCPNQAVAFESGFGDGLYSVEALVKEFRNSGERIKEVRIVLIGGK